MQAGGPWRVHSLRPRSVAGTPDPEKGWPNALGRKVSVRLRLHGDPNHSHTEALGVVRSVREAEGGFDIELVTRSGRDVSFTSADVTHVKVF